MFQTYQTKLKNEIIVLPSEKKQAIFDYYHAYAQSFGVLERKLFVDLYVRKKPSNALKTHYCAVYAITSRQYNSVKNQLDGRVKSNLEKRKYDMEELKNKVAQTESLIEKKSIQKESAHVTLAQMKGNESNFLKKVKNYRSLRHYIHQKKRKLHRMKTKLEKVQKEVSNGSVSLCFGSKKLFHKQFHLEENNLSFDQWKKQWQEKRASQFTFIGSKDETYGNQTCTYDLLNNLRIRVSAKDEDTYGKYIVVPNVTFDYGQENLDLAKIPTIGYSKGKGNKTTYYRALTCKFIRKEDSWYLNMSVDVDVPSIQTLQNNGAIGVDFNAHFLAVTEVDRFGNYLHTCQVPFQAYHVSSEQAKQSLSEALKIVVHYALDKQKPIMYENLNFQKKKQQLKQLGKKQAKMLSGFAYSSYQEMLVSKCQKAGVETKSINPAYTSQIGHHKFMKKYGLSSHASAALIIARKGFGFRQIEKVPKSHLLTGNKRKIVASKRFNQWKELTKQWKKYSFKQKNYALYQMM